MKKNKRRSTRIRLAISAIIGVVIALVLTISPTRKNEFDIPITEEEYNFLKCYALDVAETLDKEKINDDDIETDWWIYQEFLYVKVVKSYECAILAKYPIEFLRPGIELCWFNIDYNNVVYTEIPIREKLFYGISIATGIFVGALIFFVSGDLKEKN